MAVPLEGVPYVTKTDQVASLNSKTKEAGVLQKLLEGSKSKLVSKY